jgi:hypothetical protein
MVYRCHLSTFNNLGRPFGMLLPRYSTAYENNLRRVVRTDNLLFEEITITDTTAQARKWKNMRATEKAASVGKLCIFMISFSFVFPTLLND